MLGSCGSCVGPAHGLIFVQLTDARQKKQTLREQENSRVAYCPVSGYVGSLSSLPGLPCSGPVPQEMSCFVVVSNVGFWENSAPGAQTSQLRPASQPYVTNSS